MNLYDWIFVVLGTTYATGLLWPLWLDNMWLGWTLVTFVAGFPDYTCTFGTFMVGPLWLDMLVGLSWLVWLNCCDWLGLLLWLYWNFVTFLTWLGWMCLDWRDFCNLTELFWLVCHGKSSLCTIWTLVKDSCTDCWPGRSTMKKILINGRWQEGRSHSSCDKIKL